MTPDDDLSARAAAAVERALADTTLPEGVLTEGPASGEASALLHELLRAFARPRSKAQRALPDVEDAAERARMRASALRRLPPDAGSPKRFSAELVGVLPTLRELVGELRELRRLCCADPLPTGATLEAGRARIVERWNAAVDAAGAVALSPLCEVCGRPVVLRQSERGGKLSTVCGDVCRDARKKRSKRRRAP